MEHIPNLSIDLILPPGNDIRSATALEGIEELANSIASQGIIQPIIVTPRGDKYEIIAGNRRYQAAKIAELVTVPVIVRKETDEKIDLLRMEENLCREELNAVDIAKHIKRMLTKYGYTTEIISRITKHSETWVREKLHILQFPLDIQAALEGSLIGQGVAKELAKIDDDEYRRMSLGQAIDNGITAQVARIWSDDFRKMKTTIQPGQNEPQINYTPPQIPEITSQCYICDCPMGRMRRRVIIICDLCFAEFENQKRARDAAQHCTPHVQHCNPPETTS